MIEVNSRKKGGVYTFSCVGTAADPYGACASILCIALDLQIHALVSRGAAKVQRSATAATGAYFVEASAAGGDGVNDLRVQEVMETVMSGFTWLTAHYPEHVKVNAEVEQA